MHRSRLKPGNPDFNYEVVEGTLRNGEVVKYAVTSDGRRIKLLGSQYAGSVNKNGIPFDKNGFVDFSEWVIAEVRLPDNMIVGRSWDQARVATEEFYKQLKGNEELMKKFNFDELQWKAIKSGKGKIPGYTWHHHQDTGRMQLVPTSIHKKGLPHTGGHALWGSQKLTKE